VFRAEARGRRLVMENAGVVGGNEVFKDVETGSRWQQSSLEAISGPLKGEHLELYPFLLTSWEEWLRLHPDTLVLKPLPGYAERIPAKNAQLRVGYPVEKAAPSDVLHRDDRLKAYTKIIGLTVGSASRAYPLDALAKTLVANEELGGQSIVVVHQPKSDTTTAFVARVDGRRLTFAAKNAGATALTDRETQSTWNAYGECTSGQLSGKQLEALILEPEYWFAWSEFHPATSIYSPQGR
jgi:Protein of unknown function (DUF3179)